MNDGTTNPSSDHQPTLADLEALIADITRSISQFFATLKSQSRVIEAVSIIREELGNEKAAAVMNLLSTWDKL